MTTSLANENSVKTGKLPIARENAVDQTMIGIRFESHWLGYGPSFLDQSQGEVKKKKE